MARPSCSDRLAKVCPFDILYMVITNDFVMVDDTYFYNLPCDLYVPSCSYNRGLKANFRAILLVSSHPTKLLPARRATAAERRPHFDTVVFAP